jgi:hypothetical protein
VLAEKCFSFKTRTETKNDWSLGGFQKLARFSRIFIFVFILGIPWIMSMICGPWQSRSMVDWQPWPTVELAGACTLGRSGALEPTVRAWGARGEHGDPHQRLHGALGRRNSIGNRGG